MRENTRMIAHDTKFALVSLVLPWLVTPVHGDVEDIRRTAKPQMQPAQ